MSLYLLPVIAYLFGSVSTAIITCKLMHLPDPRTSGSNNPGATNVLRLGGKKAAAITLVGDMIKGLLPTLIAQTLSASPVIVALTAVAAFFGHLFPLFFDFKGGKGVATAIGATFGLSLIAGLLVSATWLAVSFTFKISSMAALLAFVFAPFFLWLATNQSDYVIAMLVITLVLFWRHKDNIQRLIRGIEPNINKK